MRKVTVELPGRNYDILIGSGLLQQTGSQIAALGTKGSIVVLSDDNVWRLYQNAFTATMQEAGLPFTPIIVPAGEASKGMHQLEEVFTAFAEANLSRNGLVVAFGGGVVGDLAGFAAATWMRGVDFIQIPTTLLAQVDSSVGGKTAVNHPKGKNLIGAFYQPRLVLADTDLLDTLPAREYACGMAEVIKYGAIAAPALFETLRSPCKKDQLPAIIEECCRIKSEIVGEDERDNGQRMLLNFGHSFGHAIEALGGFTTYTHGQAVAMGMVLAARYGQATGQTTPGIAEQLAAVLTAHGIDYRLPCPPAELIPQMRLDKKGSAASITLVLLKEIGQAFLQEQRFEQIESIVKELA